MIEININLSKKEQNILDFIIEKGFATNYKDAIEYCLIQSKK
jgi:hypothetical protein